MAASSTEATVDAWTELSTTLGDLHIWAGPNASCSASAFKSNQKIRSAAVQLKKAGINQVFFEWFLEKCLDKIKKKYVPEFHEDCEFLMKSRKEEGEDDEGSQEECTNQNQQEKKEMKILPNTSGEDLLRMLRGWNVEKYSDSLDKVLGILLKTRTFILNVSVLLMLDGGRMNMSMLSVSSYSSVREKPPNTPFWQRVDAQFFTKMPTGFQDGMMAFANMRFLQYQKLQKIRKVTIQGNATLDAKQSVGEGGQRKADTRKMRREGKMKKKIRRRSFRVPPPLATCYDHQLREIGWMRFVEKAFSRVIYARIESRLANICAGVYNVPQLDNAISWMKLTVLRWLQCFTNSDSSTTTTTAAAAAAAATPTVSLTKRRREKAYLDPSAASSTTTTSSSSSSSTSGVPDATSAAAESSWHQRVVMFTYRKFAAMRIDEMWDIILEFPDTEAALCDLRKALAFTGDHHLLIQSLKHTFNNRLLTPGANTQDILLQYSYTIGALCVVDPTRIILKAIGPRICGYLRSRSDTVRCIVGSLIDPKGDEKERDGLAELAADLDPLGNTEERHSDDETGDPFEWEPDAILADSSKVRGATTAHKSDILQMLMTIYGSNALFIKEYRLLLADLLVNKIDYDTDKQVQQLELLKIRFGENAMHACDVMLRDLANSKRINSHIRPALVAKDAKMSSSSSRASRPTTPAETPIKRGRVTRQTRQSTISFRSRKSRASPTIHIHSDTSGSKENDAKSSQQGRGLKDTAPVTPPGATTRSHIASSSSSSSIDYDKKFLEATIISKEFWPERDENELKLPAQVARVAELYSEQFTKLKAPRVLRLMPSLGKVHLEIELEDRQLDLEVTPIQASCLAQFGETESDQLTLNDIAEGMACDLDLCRRALAFWLQKKVIKEVKSEDGSVISYRPLEKLTGEEDDDHNMTISLADDNEDLESALRSQRATESKKVESYIMGVVVNFKTVTLQHIKNMLKLLTSDEAIRLTDRQIMDTLERMAKSGKIECRDGRYRSIKKRR
eukprot:jgi/Bigna1/73813/fgenesh1_pg.26_\